MSHVVECEPSGVSQALGPAEVPGFARVYDETFDLVWRTLRRMGIATSRLDDVTQEVFLVVSQRLDSFDPSRGHVRSWVYGIVVHVVRNERRRARRKDEPLQSIDLEGRMSGDERFASSAPGPHEAAETREAMDLAAEILASLPEDRREVLMLADLEEMPVVEVAEALGLNVNTAYARLRTARRELDEALARLHARGRMRP